MAIMYLDYEEDLEFLTEISRLQKYCCDLSSVT